MEQTDAVLVVAAENLEQVTAMYKADLQAQQVSPMLRVRIKNVLENQRSALDYLAWEIAARYGKEPGRHTYYPMAMSVETFPAAFDDKLPGVSGARDDIKEAIERHQPYNQEWLRNLSTLVIDNKHRTLTAQERQERTAREWPPRGEEQRLEQSPEAHPAGVGIYISGDQMSWDPSVVKVMPGGGIYAGGVAAHEVAPTVTYVDWLFDEPKVSVLTTLNDIQQGVSSAVADICVVAGL